MNCHSTQFRTIFIKTAEIWIEKGCYGANQSVVNICMKNIIRYIDLLYIYKFIKILQQQKLMMKWYELITKLDLDLLYGADYNQHKLFSYCWNNQLFIFPCPFLYYLSQIYPLVWKEMKNLLWLILLAEEYVNWWLLAFHIPDYNISNSITNGNHVLLQLFSNQGLSWSNMTTLFLQILIKPDL